MNWQICAVQPEYLDDLRQLYLESRIQTFTWLDASTFKRDDFDSATAEEKLLVAITDGKPIGFISWWLPDNFIHHLYVDPRFLHQGVGTALLRQCLANIGRPARLKCLQQNTNALAFYLAQGWRINEEGTSAEGAFCLMVFTG
ncbi:GNAT family N-acetyltransferase [Spirosoma agri]|uniref:GNAT family N-acetyltransferase n=1 Tax=Spirosoma agri TaxID=1987381 RepID=A0A6M0IKC7_9BACT|nr:GNAT family N-acetyltransferase [Spirosoma agri]NEU68738.1 GNAT family N-acetyltransferase [Spirosoma agri]